MRSGACQFMCDEITSICQAAISRHNLTASQSDSCLMFVNKTDLFI